MNGLLTTSVPNIYVRNLQQTPDGPPPIDARFFYTSPLAIDHPLSPLPPPLTTSSATYRAAPRPFSSYDNIALNKTWLETRALIKKRREQDGEEKTQSRRGTTSAGAGSRPIAVMNYVPSIQDGKRRSLAGSLGSQRIPHSPLQRPHRVPSTESLTMRVRGRESVAKAADDESPSSSLRAFEPTETVAQLESTSTTGNPFIRAPSRKDVRNAEPRTRSTSRRPTVQPLDSYDWGEEMTASNPATSFDTKGRKEVKDQKTSRQRKSSQTQQARVPVGVSRLHNVVIPDLKMEPIYWSPVNDIALVVRGTWFYADSMLPVEVDVANMLEVGYISLRPWTEEWKEELNSAVEVGALGEMKILHRLWPDTKNKRTTVDISSRPNTARDTEDLSNNLLSTALAVDDGKDLSKVAANAGLLIDQCTDLTGPDNKACGQSIYGRDGTVRSYQTGGIIYANTKEAYILRQSLQPSDYYGRRPLANYIRKGKSIGVRVVRGFDQALWDKIHPPPKGTTANKARLGVSSSQAGDQLLDRHLNDPTLSSSKRPEVTDLVLVVHGIGQKLSERVESYHFTHAMNAFRREVNVELGTPAVRAHLQPDMGGIMVLPVNWRLTLSFEEGGYREEADDSNLNEYTLKDITPEGLSSVRGIVSDVMLDIPYYLSNEHRPKMVTAVALEANRIYQRWCSNNPGFEKHGRVHLIAHSLGSVMAIDILSSQPTHVESQSYSSPATNPAPEDLPSDHFIFNVANLFTAGSPCGFFLLLKNANLLPRCDRSKPGADEYDAGTPGVAGEQGTYGCLAVDNIYNIINPYDPVSYHLNACIDSAYAASLKPAWIPNSVSSFFSFANPFRASGAGTVVTPSTATKPTLPRLPSTVEMETHDFSREEIAEKRAFLLNDNGQVDYLLRYGGGPLEIQYLTMLGAHSSYWLSKDFIRMIVQEVGRRPGRDGTLASMRAMKKKGGAGGVVGAAVR